MQSNWHGNDASRGKTFARNNGTKESCREQVTDEQMLVLLMAMSPNFKMQKCHFKKEKNYLNNTELVAVCVHRTKGFSFLITELGFAQLLPCSVLP